MQIIAIPALPSFSVSTTLSGQACTINVYQKSTGVYADILVNDVVILSCRLCVNQIPLVRKPYLGFIGDLCFFDTQGNEGPQYTGFGSRWLLLYLAPADLA